MESTGARNRIHCSQATATLLESAGKTWTTHRDDLVHAKGKGELQTHWVELAKQSSPSRRTGSTLSTHEEKSVENIATPVIDDKEWAQVELTYTSDKDRENVESKERRRRLVDWNADLLCRLLKQVVAHNQLNRESHSKSTHYRALHASNAKTFIGRSAGIDEVVEVIELPESRFVSVRNLIVAGCSITLESTVVEQVRLYVKSIADLYPNNHFHNFEHVSVMCGN
jgi:hypothetical protein